MQFFLSLLYVAQEPSSDLLFCVLVLRQTCIGSQSVGILLGFGYVNRSHLTVVGILVPSPTDSVRTPLFKQCHSQLSFRSASSYIYIPFWKRKQISPLIEQPQNLVNFYKN